VAPEQPLPAPLKPHEHAVDDLESRWLDFFVMIIAANTAADDSPNFPANAAIIRRKNK
jgi:hypothetical protein